MLLFVALAFAGADSVPAEAGSVPTGAVPVPGPVVSDCGERTDVHIYSPYIIGNGLYGVNHRGAGGEIGEPVGFVQASATFSDTGTLTGLSEQWALVSQQTTFKFDAGLYTKFGTVALSAFPNHLPWTLGLTPGANVPGLVLTRVADLPDGFSPAAFRTAVTNAAPKDVKFHFTNTSSLVISDFAADVGPTAATGVWNEVVGDGQQVVGYAYAEPLAAPGDTRATTVWELVRGTTNAVQSQTMAIGYPGPLPLGSKLEPTNLTEWYLRSLFALRCPLGQTCAPLYLVQATVNGDDGTGLHKLSGTRKSK